MENPKHEIQHVVRSLCQGTTDEQRRTLDRYFTPDAEFVHPFCVAPRFRRGALRHIPLLNKLSSRDVVRGVYQWYRMLSPKVEMEFDAVLLDRARDKIFLDIRQNFSIWFIPWYHARVRLVTVLDLVACDPSRHDDGEPRAIKQDGEEDDDDDDDDEDDDNDDNEEEQEKSSALPGSYPGVNNNHHPARSHHHRRPAHALWRIARQEDLYQVNEYLKFVGPFWWCLWRVLWFPFQLGATAVCVLLSLFVALSPWAFQKDPAAGGVEAAATAGTAAAAAAIGQAEVYYDDAGARHGKSGGARGGSNRSRGPVTPPRKHSKARKKSTR
ncbi:hypothetical protein VMCG_02552 [Cytospora schulzeri]|uniref:SigF-like NTF2-like domain-containing protein n=1 Tax=Cytospora schulzeri TaxID=448051 RepID=A0A423X171_9PEZI|nr:hypothetical protein VMCG_02552 [Valsa malicola]